VVDLDPKAGAVHLASAGLPDIEVQQAPLGGLDRMVLKVLKVLKVGLVLKE